MNKPSWIFLAAGALCVIACAEPAGVASARATAVHVTKTNASSGVSKEPIAGTISFLNHGSLAGFRMTPSGQCFYLNQEVNDQFDGDVVGPVTFYENQRAPCDFSHLTGSGPFVAHVTWNGRSGTISGQWTTNCKADASQPVGLACDGTTNARGADGLEGVQFHFKWGPGWYPFAYTGTAFAE
ncbi:MAG: hypothetical protein ACRENK_16005 [Gemmatimonadaceae bacterium]